MHTPRYIQHNNPFIGIPCHSVRRPRCSLSDALPESDRVLLLEVSLPLKYRLLCAKYLLESRPIRGVDLESWVKGPNAGYRLGSSSSCIAWQPAPNLCHAPPCFRPEIGQNNRNLDCCVPASLGGLGSQSLLHRPLATCQASCWRQHRATGPESQVTYGFGGFLGFSSPS